MQILTRYILRAHLGPFLFAFTTVTGLLFLNAVAQRMEEFAGKGLHWSVIAEFMVLSLPHIIALTFPMAVLVAVLYAFSELTASNEITAMAAGGVRPTRLLIPLLGVSVILAGLMVGFNDRVLPESNHRLSNLLLDVGSKSPTFELREEVVNPVQTADDTRYFLRAREIDQATNELTDVSIFDLSTFGRYRTVHAARGTMYFDESRTDLIIALEDGEVLEVGEGTPAEFHRLAFQEQVVRMPGVGSELERRTEGRRGDREMTIAMLRERMEENLSQAEQARQESMVRSRSAVLEALGSGEGLEPSMNADTMTAGTGVSDGDGEFHAGLRPDEVTSFVRGTYDVNVSRADIHQLTAYSYQVEIHKKWAIAFACIVFVLLGAPLAIRFPRGGVGMVIAVSVGIFFLYWAGLIAGERLADRGHLHPIIAMWAPNVILLVPALILAYRMGREISTMRGGTWDQLKYRIGVAIRRPFSGRKAEIEA